jgi:hypothetical protein
MTVLWAKMRSRKCALFASIFSLPMVQLHIPISSSWPDIGLQMTLVASLAEIESSDLDVLQASIEDSRRGHFNSLRAGEKISHADNV